MRSIARGTLRSLHFQHPPHVVRGAILDVAVDLRQGSPSNGGRVMTTLTEEGCEQIFIPAGFAHGCCTLGPMTEVAYKVDACLLRRGSRRGVTPGTVTGRLSMTGAAHRPVRWRRIPTGVSGGERLGAGA